MVIKWNTRMSLVYAVGIWTMVGSYAYLNYTSPKDDVPAPVEEEESDDPNKHIYKGTYLRSVIVYKKDFVPYSTRIYNFIKSFSDGTESRPGAASGPGQGDK
uniref:Long intergenic non-protein coding RNA 493 n=1 Tax=Nothobranchius korthausae TaxID=1143690 RepID=A0A1A8FUJ1_9TELE